MALTRKHFIQAALGVTGTAALSAACGDDTGSGGSTTNTTGPTGPVTVAPSSTTGTQNGCGSSIADNHGHTLTVTAAEVNMPEDRDYDITGSSPHSHTVTLTAADFQALGAGGGGSVTVESSLGGGHTHSITVMCTIV
jgi:hypothetical protein